VLLGFDGAAGVLLVVSTVAPLPPKVTTGVPLVPTSPYPVSCTMSPPRGSPLVAVTELTTGEIVKLLLGPVPDSVPEVGVADMV
jgi:hypothetical protein